MREERKIGFLNGSLEPFTIIKDVAQKWLVICLLALGISRLFSVAVDILYTPEYTASGTYVVSQRAGSYAYANLNAAIQTAEDMEKILESSVLQKKVCEELALDTFSGRASAEVIPETNLMTVSMTASTPELAYRLLVATMENYPLVSEYLLGDVVMEVMEAPVVPVRASNEENTAGKARKAFYYSALGLAVLFAAVSFLKDTVRTEKDGKTKLEGSHLGTVYHEMRYKTLLSMIRRPKKGILITNPTCSFRYVETLRKLGMKIKNTMDERGDKVLLISSVQENEGKSTLAANLALVLAQETEKVLLLDADFRKPAQYKIFEKDKKEIQELGYLLRKNGQIEDYIRQDEKTGLYYIMGSKTLSDATELVGGECFRNLIYELKESMDYVIIDTSPMAFVPDAEEIAEVADASLLVVRQHWAQAIEINDAIEIFDNSSSRYLGFVLNNLFDSMGSVSQYGYGYGYGYSYGYGYGSYGHYGRHSRKNGHREDFDQ